MNSFPNFKIDLESYQSKSFSNEWLGEIYQRNWFKLFTPKNLNGAELSLSEGLEQIIAASAVHGSIGWNVNLGSGAGYFYRFFDAETAQKIFADPKSVIAGSGHATGKALPTEGGFKVTGSWDKCSGAAHATHFSANAVFEDGRVHSIIFTRDQVKLTDTWNMFAMKATSSFSFEVNDVFVPENFVFDIGTAKHDDLYPISKIPFDIFARFCMISTLIGTVKCFANHLENEFQQKIRNFETDFKNIRYKLESDQSSMLQLAQRYWSLAEGDSPFTEHHALNLQNGIRLMSRSLFDASCDLYYKTGITLADEKTLAHHACKDVLMASQHGMVK